MTVSHTLLIVAAWMIAGASPGPAMLAISGTAMTFGRRAGVAIAAGVVAGSASWGVAAALGVGAIMLANVWLFEAVRYAGAAYLLYLALKSAKSALKPSQVSVRTVSGKKLFSRGLLLHLTNPKAILSWGSVYAIALPPASSPLAVAELFFILISTSMIVFFGYAFLFSHAAIAAGYARTKRAMDGLFALLFGAASLKILTARLGD